MRGWMGGALGIAALGASIGSFASCRQIAGIQDNPPTASTNACGLPYGTGTCAACAQSSCCAESNACAEDPPCAVYQSCVGPCNGDPGCTQQCMQDHPVPSSDVSLLSACLASRCESECGLSCGGFAGYALDPDAATGCSSCLVAKACGPTRACARSADCDAIHRADLLCFSASDCIEAIDLTHNYIPPWAPGAGDGGAAAPIVNPFNDGLATCAAECEQGSWWACVGHVEWPPSKSPTLTFHFAVRDYATGNGLPGLSVSACSAADLPCTGPLASGTTSTSGEVVLGPFSPGGGGPGEYLKVTGPNIIPMYYYWGFPTSESQLSLFTFATSPTNLQSLWGSLNVMQDLSRGYVTVRADDCRGAVPAGVEVSLSTADTSTRGFTLSGIETTVTDSAGIISFANVPAGSVVVTTTPLALRGRVSGRTTAQVQAGWQTVVLAYPTPMP